MKTSEPNADYTHLTMVGHSNGGDTAMYFAKHHPDMYGTIAAMCDTRVDLEVLATFSGQGNWMLGNDEVAPFTLLGVSARKNAVYVLIGPQVIALDPVTQHHGVVAGLLQ